MSIEKRLLASHAVQVLAGLLIRVYRLFHFGGVRFRHDPALVKLLRSRERVIFAVWHQDFLYTLGYVSLFNTRRPTWVLASASRDGGLATAAARAVGFRGAVRGSSARGGTKALRELQRLLGRENGSLAVVCDGPRPPARHLKSGVLYLARETGLPIWLLRTSYDPVKVLSRTWARFVIPHLFARAVAVGDGPIHVPAEVGRQGLEAIRVDVEERLNRLADKADALVARIG